MLRNEPNESDFLVELQKMIIKEKYDKIDEPMDDESNDDSRKEDNAEVDNKVVDRLEAKARLVYDKEDRSLNLGRMRASDYKFNKMVHLPKPESVKRESLHEVRKDQMLRVFKEVVNNTEVQKEE